MTQRLRKSLVDLWFVLALGVAVALPAHAGLISTDEARAPGERARVKALLERPELAGELERMGVPPLEAQARVDAMTPQEVSELAGRVDALAAGGALSNQELLLIIVLLLVLIIIL